MDFLNQIKKRQRDINLSNIMNFSPLTNEERNHLMKIYGLLAMGTIVSALSCYVDIYYFKVPKFIASIISLVCSFLLASSCNSHYQLVDTSKKRLVYFAGISSSIGILISDYINYVNYLNPSILPLAFFGSLSIFCCFSLAAIFSKNRISIFLGAVLCAVCSYVALISFMNFFIRSKFIDTTLLYTGFFMYMGFVLFDTQITLFDFRRGNKDYIMHSICLYLDLVGLFTHLLRILGQKEEKKKK
ncbi:putative bax inhibitor 1 [Plasmodium gaboni]|uniref:Bax inhibitor 1, putative n=1 Tax=Plasmodium gaboni TaxID=647221 RepID=A0A151LB90_9APIC|nr:putative bax inhibitor 1 [Plasmodium gaboni]KYN96189.1 putative bax inhibitor 1 [Plasmodium gaboni]SOV19608.1 bax inhibitor 1, putative [Plasmodium gaboni]SOV25318.1 bax inhibitor 1, putative [Plasmodium sp. DRC-Itaito]